MGDTAGEVKMNSYAKFSDRPLHTDMQVLDDQQELIYDSSVQTQDIVYRTCQKQWMIALNGEREREIHASTMT